MAQSTFFGLTSYGAGTAYGKTIAKPLHFHEIPDDRFTELFHEHALGQCELASVLEVSSRIVLGPSDVCAYARKLCKHPLQVDGATTMLTKEVVKLFEEACGRKATVAEVNAVQTYVAQWNSHALVMQIATHVAVPV